MGVEPGPPPSRTSRFERRRKSRESRTQPRCRSSSDDRERRARHGVRPKKGRDEPSGGASLDGAAVGGGGRGSCRECKLSTVESEATDGRAHHVGRPDGDERRLSGRARMVEVAGSLRADGKPDQHRQSRSAHVGIRSLASGPHSRLGSLGEMSSAPREQSASKRIDRAAATRLRGRRRRWRCEPG